MLDEPYLGLDVQNREVFYHRLMEDIERNPRTIILSTHHIDDAERILDEVIFIDKGRVTGQAPFGGSGQNQAPLRLTQAMSDVLDAWSSAISTDPVSFFISDASSPGLRRLTIDVAPGSSEETALLDVVERAGVHLVDANLAQTVLALTGRGTENA